MADVPTSAEDWVARGDRARAAGTLAEAVAAYERALAIDPRSHEAHNGLGTACMLGGRREEGAAHYRRAIALCPAFHKAHNNLGNALQAMGDLEGAIEAFRRAIALQPGAVKPLSNLGNALRAAGRLDEAAQRYRDALAIDPDHVPALNNLGLTLRRQGNAEGAVEVLRRAVELAPNSYEALCNLGGSLNACGRPEDAIPILRRAVGLEPRPVDALCSLGAALQDAGRKNEAVECYASVLAHDPNSFQALNNLGVLFLEQGAVDEALSYYERARAARPGAPETHNNLGNVWSSVGEAAKALACYEKAVELAPNFREAESNLLFTMHYGGAHTPEAVLAAHRRYGARFEPAMRPSRAPRAGRKLRIGYVSPDFRTHSVAFFIEPVLANHDSDRFEVYGYANVLRPDEVTERLSTYTTRWRNVAALGHQRTAELIAADGIDVLVDLAGHTAGNCLPVFARRPAPVQITYLGYPNTTGLTAIDYRLTDASADPPGHAESLHTEALVRLPSTAWCYRPPPGVTEAAAPPSRSRGYVTFGSFNNTAKISEEVIELWCRILDRVPGSRLFLKGKILGSRLAQARLHHLFASRGIGPERLELVPWSPSREDHLKAYGEIDIALDTFPYHGTTTTCEALWMGVPVVVLAGRTHVSRVGVSLLTSVGLDDWIALSPEAYVEKAVRVAGNLATLSALRSGMRTRMARSPLMDEAAFVEALENTFESLWDRTIAHGRKA